MRSIMVLNSKGGSGKSTIATNLASYYAYEAQQNVVLADFDPQGSSIAWHNARDGKWPEITAIRAWEEPMPHSRSTDVVIIDAPARVHGPELTKLVNRVETIIVPVLPSPIDMRAASDFIRELLSTGKVSRKQTKVAVIANRIRESTIIYEALYAFLERLHIPFVATLRDTQNYIKAEEKGVGIFEMAPSQVWPDLEDWEPLLLWLQSKRSQPS